MGKKVNNRLSLNPLHSVISVNILHTILITFLLILTRRIFLTIKFWWVIVSFNLVTLTLEAEVILEREIRYYSRLGIQGLTDTLEAKFRCGHVCGSDVLCSHPHLPLAIPPTLHRYKPHLQPPPPHLPPFTFGGEMDGNIRTSDLHPSPKRNKLLRKRCVTSKARLRRDDSCSIWE